MAKYLQGDNYRRGDGFSTTRSVKKVSFSVNFSIKLLKLQYNTKCLCFRCFDVCVLLFLIYKIKLF